MGDENKGESGQSIFGRIWERFGEVAKRLGLVGDADVQEALSQQEQNQPRKRIGEILVEGGKLSAGHVEEVLRHQKGHLQEPKKSAPKKAPAKQAKKGAPAKKKSPKAKAKPKSKAKKK